MAGLRRRRGLFHRDLLLGADLLADPWSHNALDLRPSLAVDLSGQPAELIGRHVPPESALRSLRSQGRCPSRPEASVVGRLTCDVSEPLQEGKDQVRLRAVLAAEQAVDGPSRHGRSWRLAYEV